MTRASRTVRSRPPAGERPARIGGTGWLPSTLSTSNLSGQGVSRLAATLAMVMITEPEASFQYGRR